MASEWPCITLEEVGDPRAKAFTMGPFGSKIRKSNYVESGVPVLRGGNLQGERFTAEGFAYLTEEKAEELSGSHAKPGDIVFVAQGSVGSVGLVPSNAGSDTFVLSQNLMRVRLDTEKANPLYVFYYFRSPLGQHEILSYVNPTGVPCVSRPLTSLRSFRVPLPPLPEQRRIAAILGALDDKIELNRKMNRTLEEMAQAIFKSWFIDFDGHTDLVDSELGPIPRGWGVEPIGEAAKAVGGGTPSTKKAEFWEGGTHCWTTPKDLSALSTPVLLDTARKITDAGLEKISSGLLPIGTVLLSSRAPVGYLAVAQVPVAVNQGYIALLPSDRLSTMYLLHWCRANLDRIKARAGGTTFQEISKRNFRPLLALIPPQEEVTRFDSAVEPMFNRVVANEWETRTLAELRDTLLPKLISGEIRVPEGEQAIEEVV